MPSSSSMTAWLNKAATLLATALLLAGCTAPGNMVDTISSTSGKAEMLNGTHWSLVAIQSMDDATYLPAADTQYSLAFLPQGRFTGQADCNRIGGGWVHAGKSRLEFNGIISTRVLCPPQSIAERFLSGLEYTRSFVLQDGHLFLATLADGAILEFRPLPDPPPAPAFDCKNAEGAVEALLCEDTALMRLDRYLDELYQAALARFPQEELADLRAYQRGWISGRNECWKEENVRACIVAEYNRRLSELEVKTGYLTVSAPVDYTCDDGTSIAAFFYHDAVVPLAVLNRENAPVFAWLARSGSGSRYAGRNIEFWLKGDEATLTTLTAATTCRSS